MILYHATFRARLKSIRNMGLGAKQIKNWGISESGVVYLCDDADVAASYCDCAENVSDSVYDSGIIVLAVDSRILDKNNIRVDGNIHDDTKSYIYRGVIPPEKIAVVNKDDKIIGNLTKISRVPTYLKT